MQVSTTSRMPGMVRIGEALLAPEMVTPNGWMSRWSSNAMISASWASCWSRQGVITRARPCSRPPWPQDGHPVVDVENFAVEPDAVFQSCLIRQPAAEVLPLAIVTADSSSRWKAHPARRAGRAEFITQLRSLPTLTKLGTLVFSIPQTFGRYGSDPTGGSAGSDFNLPSFARLQARQHQLLNSLGARQTPSKGDEREG